MARQTKIYQVKFETEGFKAVARSFESINGQIDQTLRNYKQSQKVGVQQARDSQGRFVRSRLGLNVERDDRFIQRKNGDNEYRSKSRGRFAFENTEQSGGGRSQLESSAKIQGEIIGQHVAQAIRASFRGETKAQVDGNSIQTAIKSGFEFAVTSTFSGAFQRIGEKTIADPVLSAMRQAFAENRKIDQNLRKRVDPVSSVGSGVGFAARSFAFGGIQAIGSRLSDVITADFVKGFSTGFKSKGNQISIEKMGETVGRVAGDPVGAAKESVRERKIAKLDDSLAKAEELSKQEDVKVQKGKTKIFTVQGLGGGGKGDKWIADFNESLAKIGIDATTADIENTRNPHTGTNYELSDPVRFASDAIFNKYASNEIINSQNQDAIELAAKVISAIKNDPEAKINLIGHSAGADIVQQTIAILEKGGYAKNVQGIGVGGIDIGTGFDVQNFRNIAGENDYVVKATAPIGSKANAQDFGQIAQLGDHKLRPYFSHPDFIKSLDDQFQPTAVVKVLDSFYEDMIQAYGDENIADLEKALQDGQKFAEEFEGNFGEQETARINESLEKYHQKINGRKIQSKPNHGKAVDRQFQRVEELRSLYRGAFQPEEPGQNVPTPDTTAIVDRQFQQVEELKSLVRGVSQPGQAGQTGIWNPDRPIPPGLVPDIVPASARSLMAAAQARAQQMRPSQLIANEQGQMRPPLGGELPQLIQAYQKSIVAAFEKSREDMLRSLQETIVNMAQSPVESDQEGFASSVKASMTEQARKLLRAYQDAISAIVGVSADPKEISQSNFGTELEQVREDVGAILDKFRASIVQNFQETAGLMETIAQTYQGEAPAQMAGSSRQPYAEDFNEIIQGQLTEYQRNIRQLFAEVLQNSAADFTDLRRLRAQLGLPAQAPKAGISARYGDRLQQLIGGAQAGAQQRIRGMIPGFQEMTPKQRAAELKKMRSELTQGLSEFRTTMGRGDKNAARQLGEGLLQRIEAIRVAYEDLGKNFTGDKRGIGAQKGQLTRQSNQIQAALEGIAKNATGSLAEAIEADLGSVEGAGEAIGDALIESTEDSLGISSPSKVFQRIGEQVGQGFEIGAVKALKEARAAIQKEIQYLVALQQGDMGKAAGMVGNQAKKKGYNVGPVYHGTKNAFTAFDPKRAGQRDPGWYGQGFYFTKKQADAEYYAKAHHNDQSHIMNVRLRQSNPLNVDNENDLANRIQAAGGDPNLQGKKLADQIKKLGHDGVYAQGGKEIVVFKPNQIKSADTVTKTDRGKVVPLGARFDDSTDDIRGNVENLSSFISEELDQFFSDFAKQIRADLSQAGSDSIEGLTEGLKGGLADLETIASALGITLIEGTEDTLEISSPSKVFQRIGEQVGQGFEIGAVKALKEARAAIQKEIEYLVALQQGDMEKANAMVGNQAKNKGYNVGPVYHGSRSKKEFNVFDPRKFNEAYRSQLGPAFYFSSIKEIADSYGMKGHVKKSYLKLQNPFNWNGGKSLSSQLKFHDGVQTNVDSLDGQPYEFAVYNPNQIKSADTVTKTDRGKVVPLGARFDDSVADIRGNVENLSSFISEELDQFFADLAKQIRADLSQVGSDSIEGLTEGLKGGLEDLETIASALGITLIEGTEDTLEISSPSKVFQRIGANIAKSLGIGLRENLEKVKEELTDRLGELDEEVAFQATRAANKFEDMGGFPGLDAKAAQGIEMVRERISGLIDEFPALGKILAIGTEFGGSVALVIASFAAIGSILKVSGLDKFIGALSSLPETAAEAGREMESLNIAFQSVTGSSGLAADAMAYVSETAEKFGINIRSAEEAYLGLVATTRGTELEGFQTQKIFEAFAQTATLRGLDQQQQQQMFTAVQQVLGKGKLSAEEVRGQLGEIPALAFQQTLAGSLGVNLQQLDKLLSTGKLQSDALFKVAQAYESANAQMTGASDTATAALSRFDNAIVKLQRSVGAEFLAVQTRGAKLFTSVLNGLAEAIPGIVRVIKSGLILVLGNLAIQVFSSRTAVTLLRSALVSLANLIGRLLPLLKSFAIAIVAFELALKGATSVFEMWMPGLTEAEKSIRKLSLEYQELSGSIESASEAQKELGNTDIGSWLKNAAGWVFNLKERFLDAGDIGRSALFNALSSINNPLAANFATSAREEFAYADLTRAKGAVAEQIYVGTESKAETDAALVSAEKMLKLQQQMSEARTIAAGLNAADADGLEQTTRILKELRLEYNKYLEQVGEAQRRSRETITANKQLVDQLVKIRLNPNLDDYARGQIDAEIDRLIGQSEALQEGQKELDAVVSRFEVTLADFTTALKRGVERLANFRERLTNQINEERAKLLETGLRVGKGEQTIRLELDRQDFRELEEWVRSLRIESQKITERMADPILADQERTLREQADREGVGFGTGFLQRIVEENTENTEAAQQLLELQNLQNQITEGEVQLLQQALQARQSVRDISRSVTDFLWQLEQELAEITLQLQEQVASLQQQFRRSQLQKTIVAGSTGMFGSITSSVQTFLDAAGEIAQKYLGQERRKLEFEQKKYDLSTRLRDFSEGLNGATEALAAFRNGLTGSTVGITGSTGIGTGASRSATGATAELLARIRSGEGDYTSINRGYAGDTPGGMPGLTNMTIAQVQSLQRQGGAFAVGAYQFTPDTLEGAVSRSGIDRNRKFDKAAQDELALELILGGTKRPNLTAYLTGKSNDLNAALSDISYEWAAVTGASGSGAYDGDSAGNRASISVADLLPQVRAEVQGQSAKGGQGVQTSSEVARGQAIGSEILATQRSQIAGSEGEISIAVMDLLAQGENALEEIKRVLKINTRDLGVNVTALDNEVQQYNNPDALRVAETQSRQQFSDLNIRLDTQKTAIEDSIRELQKITDRYPAIIESLRATGDPLDQQQADLVQNVVNETQVPLETAKAFLKQIEEVQARVSAAYEKENEYQTQKIRIESENARIATDLGIAQTNRNAQLELELGLQEARNNLISQIAEKEREFSNRPEELKQELELLQRQYEQQKQTLQLNYDRSILDEVAFQADIQTRLTEAQAAQAEGQFGDNGIFGFRATALREENALLQEQIRYEQEVLALRERYRDPAQAGILSQTLEQARQLNQVNLQNIDTQFKTLGETIAEVAEDALGQFFEDIFTGSKTAGEALRSLAQSVLRMFAQMAAKNLAKSIFGSLGGAFGGFFGGGGGAAASTATGFWGWADGGTIPNYAQGGRVLPDAVADVMRSLVPGVDAGFRREGTKAALGIFTPGEEILSLKTGEAQRYQLLKKSLGTNPLESIMTGNFAYGGTVGINPAILNGDMGIHAPLVPVSSILQMQSGRGGSGGGNVTINYEVKTPDANSFRRSQYQIDKDATVAARKVLNRK